VTTSTSQPIDSTSFDVTDDRPPALRDGVYIGRVLSCDSKSWPFTEREEARYERRLFVHIQLIAGTTHETQEAIDRHCREFGDFPVSYHPCSYWASTQGDRPLMPSPRSRLARVLRLARRGRGPRRVSYKELLGLAVVVRLRVVTHDRERDPLPEHDRYGVIDKIVGLHQDGDHALSVPSVGAEPRGNENPDHAAPLPKKALGLRAKALGSRSQGNQTANGQCFSQVDQRPLPMAASLSAAWVSPEELARRRSVLGKTHPDLVTAGRCGTCDHTTYIASGVGPLCIVCSPSWKTESSS
jgi:hypothetical protein